MPKILQHHGSQKDTRLSAEIKKLRELNPGFSDSFRMKPMSPGSATFTEKGGNAGAMRAADAVASRKKPSPVPFGEGIRILTGGQGSNADCSIALSSPVAESSSAETL